jgi:hypothetical protein
MTAIDASSIALSGVFALLGCTLEVAAVMDESDWGQLFGEL